MIYKLGTSKHATETRANALSKQTERRPENVQEFESEVWGRGEMSGWLANFKSVTWIFAPQLYALTYTLGTRGGGTFHGESPVGCKQCFMNAATSHSESDKGRQPSHHSLWCSKLAISSASIVMCRSSDASCGTHSCGQSALCARTP